MDVCTFNAGSAKEERSAQDFQRLTAAYPILMCQEVADRKWEMEQGRSQIITSESRRKGGRRKVALLIRTPEVKILESGYVRCTRRSWVGAWGAGPSMIDAKWIVWARVQVLGVNATVATTHLVPSVQRPAHTDDAKAGHRRRLALYRKHIAAIVKWAESVDGPLVIGGDFNATPDFELLQPLKDAGLDLMSAPSHGQRAIDLLWSRGLTGLTVKALAGYSSDHKPVAATYESKVPPVPTPKPPFDRVTFRGKTMDNKTMYGLMAAEHRLGYELTVTQGCYNPGGVGASAGTHDGGGVVDLAPWDYENKVKVLRDLGWAAWYRSPSEGPWQAHIHAVMIDHGRLSASAAAQVIDYRTGRNGLANHAPDTFPYRPNPIPVFDYPAALKDERLRTRITGLQARIKTLRDRASGLRKQITYK